MDKAALRKTCLATRKALTPDQAAERSRAICRRLKTLPEFRAAAVILSYVSSKDNEVDTREIVESLLNQKATVLVPISGRDRSLAWSRLYDLSELVPTSFGLLEPPGPLRRLVTPPPGALVLVPGIAFTRDGYRIGYGGGYFDRFLAAFEGFKIGLAYDLQIIEAFEIAPHDVPMDIVVTESAAYRRMPSA